MTRGMDSAELNGLELAVVGMSCRLPGAGSPAELWANVEAGVESLSRFSDEELLRAGADPGLLASPHYVKVGRTLGGVDRFDAELFGISAREAELMDPQQRLFLEGCWEALEHAGTDPAAFPGLVGVFAGAKVSSYLRNLLTHPELLQEVGMMQALVANDKDYLATRVSYKLGLTGPSVTVQTACSTALVAVHLAGRALLAGECELALAGACSLSVPEETGYLWREGDVLSPDGRCRPFDAGARGTVFGNGMGVVVLKLLADALEDGDTVHAVIKGSSINNDGAAKAGFTAPGAAGQEAVIRAALAAAEVDARSVTLIEAHGTGTPLGDPIEFDALTRAFRAETPDLGFCAVGSVKGNVGHLGAAAGVAGLIKAILALRHRTLPPSPLFERPNPQIDFAASPFYVPTAAAPWEAGGGPRRAGVSAFGFGGTNAHVILEEAPARRPSGVSRSRVWLPLSAATGEALEALTDRVADHLRQHPEAPLADVAFTLQAGRRDLRHRRAVVVGEAAEAARALGERDGRRLVQGTAGGEPQVAFMLSGQGAQATAMGAGLYAGEPVFREWVDRAAEGFATRLGVDVRSLLYPGEAGAAAPAEVLAETATAQAALFTVEHALARLWMDWGVRPRALIGHSVGEVVAACLAGVFGFEDAVALIAARGRLLGDLPPGAMLTVSLSEAELGQYLSDPLSVAAVNAPSRSVVSGPEEALEVLARCLARRGVACRRLEATRAFHSAMVEPALGPFREVVARVALAPPEIPFLSNVTGGWITAAEATDPDYWVDHMRRPVRFAQGVDALLAEPARALLEVGPGRSLTTLARQSKARTGDHLILASLPRPGEAEAEVEDLLTAVARLWTAGVPVDPLAVAAGEERHRLPLPTYPFQRRRYWIEPGTTVPSAGAGASRGAPAERRRPPEEWFYLPSWVRAERPAGGFQGDGRAWLLLADAGGVAGELARLIREAGSEVVTVERGERFARREEGAYGLAPTDAEGYDRLLEELAEAGRELAGVVHLWAVDPPASASANGAGGGEEEGFWSLVHLSRALAARGGAGTLPVAVVTAGLQEVTGEEELDPGKAALLGPCRVIPQEHPELACRSIDVVPPGSPEAAAGLAGALLAELAPGAREASVALRGRFRWVETYRPVPPRDLPQPAAPPPGGVYLVAGGLGDLGFTLARELTRAGGARLVLTGRTPLPPRETWDAVLEEWGPEDPVSRKIARVRELEELGAAVLPVAADLADEAAVAAAVAAAEERFGPLTGAIHAAGVVGEASRRALEETGPGEWETHARAKVRGLPVLDRVLGDRPLVLRLVASSLSSVLGGLGYAAYAGANHVLDAYARRSRRREEGGWRVVNWDAWRFGSGPGETEGRPGESGVGAALTALALTPEEGAAAFRRVLALEGAGQVVVSTADLEARLARWSGLGQAVGEAAAATPAPARERPELPTPYVAPRTEVEREIARVWEEMFGLDRVGMEDDFFALGGDSLLGMQVVSRLRRRFGVDLPVRHFFEHPTVPALAQAVAEAREEDDEMDRLDGILRSIEGDAPEGAAEAPEGARGMER